MNHPTPPNGPGAAPSPWGRDPLAVALGNASLLNVGYLMLGRRGTALFTGTVTLYLLVLLAWAAPSGWVEGVVLLWWVFLVGHGWSLARRCGGSRGRVREQRIVALAFAVPLLLALAVVRVDVSGIDRTVADARRRGDCARALTAQRGLWLGHRVAGAPAAARVERTAQACRRLRAAEARLSTGLTGDTRALKAGFTGLASVLRDLPGHERMVETTLDAFLARLPTKNACATATVTDWLRRVKAPYRALNRSAATVARTAPTALTGCGDALMTAGDWEKARARYRQLLDQYPGNEHAAKAKDGVRRATLAIELAHVRRLLDDPYEPEYCSTPARYSGAAPYRRGTNRALFYGDDEYTSELPGKWRTTDVTKAVLVVCADEAENGKRVETCPYRGDGPLVRGRIVAVSFHRIAVPVKVYELRTGRLVAERKVQIGGRSCPSRIRYDEPFPPSTMFVKASKADIRDAFEPLITGRW